ncbi:MAG: hypothetical protein HY791_33075 [Deltaproteobacteria bacterium]|nr:hypothetical protein [Deltaproteobacteria bacterium]
MAELCPIPLDSLSPAARKAADPSTPLGARLMAARGLAPMSPRDLVTVQFVLTYDPDEKIAATSRSSLESIDDRIANAVLSDTAMSPHVLAFLADALTPRDALVEKVLLNTSTPSHAFVAVAQRCSEKVCEIIAINQARILDDPEIARALASNPSCLKSTRDSVFDFLVRSGVVLDDVAEFESAILRLNPQDRIKAAEAVELPPELLDEKFLSEEQKKQLGERRFIADDDENLDGEDEAQSDGARLSLKMLRELTTGQKVALAVKGKKNIRRELLRDSNRVVAMAAISSPQVNENDAVEAANMRSVHGDVINFIANKKDWVKLYAVKLALVQNPKCSPGFAMRQVGFLNKKDLKTVANSKNVSMAIRNAAGNLIKERNA